MTKIVGEENVLSSETDLLLYGYDASLFKGRPDCIVLPGSTDEVSKIVKFAHENRIHVLGRGSGTNLSGGTIPTKGGIVIHFSRMNKVLEIDLENQRAVVEPGVFTLVLKNQLARYGICLSADVRLGGITGLGLGKAPLEQTANLGALVFLPIGNTQNQQKQKEKK
jgi:glycolate oxidase